MRKFATVVLAALLAATAQACGSIDEPTADDPTSAAPAAAEPVGDAGQEIGGFSISLFPFRTTVEDDGSDVGGGYQEANTTLSFADGRQEPTARWQCSFTIGMPLRTQRFGKVDAIHAVSITSMVATSASSTGMHSQPAWTPSFFCRAFKDEMNKVFLSPVYRGLGAGVFLR